MVTDCQSALAYIHSLPHFHPDKSLNYVQRALDFLENPQNSYPTVHVTGTNGKGSVCNYLTHLLTETGYKVGTFMSPYIQNFNERIQINAQAISNEQLVTWTQRIQRVVSDLQKSDPDYYLVEFEFLVVLMFAFFQEQEVDYGIIEVGIGGKHDKTNVITPQLSIITNVGHDHEALIGPTLIDIAREKSGIIKAQRPVVVGELDSKVQDVIQKKAQELQAPWHQLTEDFKVDRIQTLDLEATQFSWQNSLRHFQGQVPSSAKTQVWDAALALESYTILVPDFWDPKLIHRALSQASLPARQQILAQEPLIIVDGAHNLPAITTLLENIRQLEPQKRLLVLYSAMVDKNREEILQVLEKMATEVWITTFSENRAAKIQDYHLLTKMKYIESWPVAFKQAVQSCDSESILVICGSLHFAGEILNLVQAD
ncbi:bifunctional folylpolyglutamate synthase/dihydrofolate synthase [Lactobacillus sp. DCY120]|uniref:tetrahydrofolate synthase n=1 Tax=Bombilactobacillus apium TaxID=2675299 RepID=A0A850QY76_9LACO|nr:folylpolyglutamate synthase/dihydrofolate synthase family protein [Bombilactobacillus apium]NVY95659.1 bifunctional folylpolyglutamate synthase/dihydrofolate synthase [Bombilactobacillus apium]